MSNPAIRTQPNGDVDISVDQARTGDLADGSSPPEPEPSIDPDNLDHPEELMGE